MEQKHPTPETTEPSQDPLHTRQRRYPEQLLRQIQWEREAALTRFDLKEILQEEGPDAAGL